jgi:multiple sugar transport system substrate-binding protein
MKLTKHCLWLVLVLVLASGSAVFAQTIVHWQHHSPARNEMIEFFAREFEAQNPGVTIEFESIPLADYYTKLLPALAAGSGPDVFQLRAGDVPRYKEYEVIQALNIDHALALEEFVPGSYGFLVEDGTFYGLPTDVQTIVLFYNTEIFAELGITEVPSTWEELIETALLITDIEDGVMYRMGLAHGSYGPVIYTLMAQTGTEFQDDDGKVLFDNPQGREGFEFAVDWIAKYGVEDPDFGSRWTAFREQELGMVYAHPAMLGSFRNTHPDLPIGIAEVASYKAGEPRTSVMTNWAYVASAGTDDLDLASRWIEFLTSAEAQRKWTIETGELPSRAALINDPELLEYEPLLAAPLASLESAVPYPFEALSQMDKAIRDAINRVTIAGESVDEAFEWFVQETEKVYREVILDEL